LVDCSKDLPETKINTFNTPLIYNKFWEELIHPLSPRKIFEIHKPNLMELNLNELTLI
jgi:hypothetical protein